MQLQSRVHEQERMETKELFQMQSARNPKISWGVSSQVFKNFTLKFFLSPILCGRTWNHMQAETKDDLSMKIRLNHITVHVVICGMVHFSPIW